MKNIDEIVIAPDDIVTVTQMHHLTEIQFTEKTNTRATVKRLNNNEFLVISTGEIKEFERTDKRSDSSQGIRKSTKALRYLINANFTGANNECFVTLTFAPDASGWRPMLGDGCYITKMFKRLSRRLTKRYGHFEFIKVNEPHADGHAHLHILMRFDDLDRISISNSDMERLWSCGFVQIESLDDVDNIGAYLSSYVTNIEVNAETLAKFSTHDFLGEKIGDCVVTDSRTGKKYIKGGRLHFYPTGAQLYNKSKGIKMPSRRRMKYKDAKKIVGSANPTFARDSHFERDGFTNETRFESYNSKRQHS